MNNKTNYILIGIVALGFLGVILSIKGLKVIQHYGDTSIQPIYAPMTSGGVLCTNGASTQLIATSTSRAFLRISNLGSSVTYYGFGVPASTSTGIALFASSSLELNQNNMFDGAIYCLGTSGAATTTYAESK